MRAEPNAEKIVKAVQLLADGIPMKQAAEQVGWNYQTLRNHLGRLYQEAGIQNVVHLAALYFRKGLIR